MKVERKIGTEESGYHSYKDFLSVLKELWPDRAVELEVLDEKCEGRGVQVTLKPIPVMKTDEQTGYYWMCLRKFGTWLGYRDVMNLHHEFVRDLAFFNIETLRDGTEKRYLQSSNDFTKAQYSSLISLMLERADFANYTLPPPRRNR